MLAARAAEKVLLLLQTDPETIAAGLLGTQAEGMLLTLGSSATGKIRDYLQKKATALQASGLSESHARLTAVVAAINTIGSPEVRLVLMNALCHTVDPTLKDASRQLREARSRELTFLRQRGIDETVISSDFAVVRMGTVLGTETDGRLQIQLVAELPLGGEVRRSQAAVTEPAELWRLFVR